jgi:parallel beta helix pectate lyase-like protein
MRPSGRTTGLSWLVFTLILVAVANGETLKVNCSLNGASEDQLSTITAALKRLNHIGPNTITVSGSCHENVVIQSFDRLTLTANPGASINDASGGTADVILIDDSQRIAIQGFTVNGGFVGIRCVSHSLCRFSGNTIQASSGDGVGIVRARAEFAGDIIQYNPNGRGLAVLQAGEAYTVGVTIRGNGTTVAAGVRVSDGSFLHAVNTTVQSNGLNGIRVTDHSALRSASNTITGNGGNGISLESGSEARFLGDDVITGNSGHGVQIADLSFADFETSGNNITANSAQPDVACLPQFSAERGALPTRNIGGGTTNCIEP